MVIIGRGDSELTYKTPIISVSEYGDGSNPEDHLANCPSVSEWGGSLGAMMDHVW